MLALVKSRYVIEWNFCNLLRHLPTLGRHQFHRDRSVRNHPYVKHRLKVLPFPARRNVFQHRAHLLITPHELRRASVPNELIPLAVITGPPLLVCNTREISA